MICECNNTCGGGTHITPAIRHVFGNVLRIAIPLTLRTLVKDGDTIVPTDTDFIPSSDYPVNVIFSKGNKNIAITAEMDGNVAIIEERGKMPVGTYDITVECRDELGQPYRFKQSTVLQVVDVTAEAGIEPTIEYEAETWYLNAAIFLATTEIGSMTEEIERKLEDVFGDVEYDAENKVIKFYDKNKTRILGTLDSTPFVVDGTVDDVYIDVSRQVLVVVLNDDAGGRRFSVPLYLVFENYYKKDEVDQRVNNKADVSGDGRLPDAQAAPVILDYIYAPAPGPIVPFNPQAGEVIYFARDHKIRRYYYEDAGPSGGLPAVVYVEETPSRYLVYFNKGNEKFYRYNAGTSSMVEIETGSGGGEGTVTGVKVGSTTYEPTNGVVDISAGIPDVSGFATALGNKVDKVSGKGLSTEDYTSEEKTKLSGIAMGAEVNVQADWNETNTSSDAYIANKPTIPDAQIQADWNQTTTTAKDYIKNKPTIPSAYDDTALAARVTTLENAGYLTTEADPTVPSWAKAESKPTYTASEVGAVPTTRTVNGKALSADITLSASDVGALPSSTTIPTVDSTPTQNSTNAVQSGAVYTALAGKQATISDLATIRTGAAAGATAIQGVIVGGTEVTPDGNKKVTIPAGADGITPHIGANGNWWVGPETDSNNDTGIKARGNDGNVTVSDGVATLVVGNALNGEGDVLGMSGAMQIKANIDILAASLNRLYAKLGNIAFWTAQDQEDAEPTPIDWSIPKVVLTVTNSITHGVVKYNGNIVSGSIQVDQGTTVNLLVEGETGYGISSAAATGATVVDNGNGTFTVSVKVDSTMSLTITGTAAALVTPSFVCSNDADALSMTGAAAAVGGTFVGTIAIDDDYFDGFSIESVKDGSDNDVSYTTSGNTITVANMPSVLVITAKATKVLKFYAGKIISGMGSVADDSGRCFTDYIRLDGLTSSAALNWIHNIDYDASKNRAIVFYDKNKKHMMNWDSGGYKDCPYHFVVNSGGSRQIATNYLSAMLSYAGGLAYVRACFDLNDGEMNASNALTQGSSSWLDLSNTESANDLVVHNITYSLTGCTTNASSSTTSHTARNNIINGENFQDTINVGNGKTLQSVTVTMDGVDITSTVYNSSTKKIVIASVTGALVITATAS